MADTQTKTPETPFGLSFEELLSQINTNAQKGQASAPAAPAPQAGQPAPVQQAGQPAPALSFDALEQQINGTAQPASNAQPAANTPNTQPNAQAGNMSFNSLVEQAQQNAQNTQNTSFEDLVRKAEAEAGIAEPAGEKPTEAAPEKEPVEKMSFEEIAKQAMEHANAQAQKAETAMNSPEGPAKEAAVPTETKEPVQAGDANGQEKEAAAENPAQPEEPKGQAGEKEAGGEPVQAEVPKEEPKEKPTEKEKPKKPRTSKSSKKQEEKKEPPQDITEDYRVDLGIGKAPEASGESPLTALFTPEEVAALRADIQAFVRKELKLAVVGAIKELLNDFGK